MVENNQSSPTLLAHVRSVPGLIYDLRLQDGGNGYYTDVAAFSVKVLAEIDARAGATVRDYAHHVRSVLKESPRSHGEYAIELLTLGLAFSLYDRAAETTPIWVVELARELFWMRRKSSRVKPLVDALRAWVTRLFLMPQITRAALPCHKSALCERVKPCSKSRRAKRLCPRFRIPQASSSATAPGPAQAGNGQRLLTQLPRLIEWLQATGEFEQETMRLNNWHNFLDTLPPADAVQWIETAIHLFDWFKREAETALGAYTRGVPRFLATEYRSRGCREDQIFCGKEPPEYHLSMVAAEVMNRGLRAEFERAAHRVVLVPACMRGAYATFCRAHLSGVDIQCAACSPDCAVNRLTSRMRILGAKVYIVPHSTGFSRWLMRWQREPNTGIIAVACLLNILPGGYEMRARGIASQCVLLDYPGCQKHWRREPIATSLNEDQLVQIVTAHQNGSDQGRSAR